MAKKILVRINGRTKYMTEVAYKIASSSLGAVAVKPVEKPVELKEPPLVKDIKPAEILRRAEADVKAELDKATELLNTEKDSGPDAVEKTDVKGEEEPVKKPARKPAKRKTAKK